MVHFVWFLGLSRDTGVVIYVAVYLYWMCPLNAIYGMWQRPYQSLLCRCLCGDVMTPLVLNRGIYV